MRIFTVENIHGCTIAMRNKFSWMAGHMASRWMHTQCCNNYFDFCGMSPTANKAKNYVRENFLSYRNCIVYKL